MNDWTLKLLVAKIQSPKSKYREVIVKDNPFVTVDEIADFYKYFMEYCMMSKTMKL